MMTEAQRHWTQAWADRDPKQVSWFAEHLEVSLEMITAAGGSPPIRVIDVGGGASTLARDLLDRSGYLVTVLDIAEPALALNREALGDRAAKVDWRVGDATTVQLPSASFDVWHDRAVFHFLTTPEGRTAYVRQLSAALRPGGQAIISTFADDGPARCSGLRVKRYSPEGLLKVLGAGFELLESRRFAHTRPDGDTQAFVAVRVKRRR